MILNDTDTAEFSVGNDLVHLPGFASSFNELFRNKAYTAEEIAYCESFAEPLLRYASTWAAKEAVYKSVKQIRPEPLAFSRIMILRDKIAGMPTVKLPQSYSDLRISLTISHDGDYVFAIAITRTPTEPGP